MSQRNCLGQILVEFQPPSNSAGDPRNLQRMGHAGAVVIPLRAQEDLRLVHQPPERFAVYDPVNVPLVAGFLLEFHLYFIHTA